MNTTVRFILPELSGQTLSANIYEKTTDQLRSTVSLSEISANSGVFDGIVTESLEGVFRYVIVIGSTNSEHGLIELYDTEETYIADTNNAKKSEPIEESDWNLTVISIIRNLTGDTDPSDYTYTDDRLLESFIVCSNLVIFDVDFEQDYTINVQDQTIDPDPTSDKDFITLCCLKTACVLLNGETKAASGCKVTMKDGPSTITMDKTDFLKNLQMMTKDVCGKYDQAMFIYKSEGTLGVAVLGPHGQNCEVQELNNRESR